MSDLPKHLPRRKRARRPTLNDVAARAGVSVVTASRVLRQPAMVSDELRQRVVAAVRALAYVPNHLASALASSRTGIVGALVPSLTNGVFSDYLRALHDVFLPAGFQVVVLNTRYQPQEEDRAIATLLALHPEAIILAGIDQSPEARHLLEQAGIPIIQTMEITDDPIDINIGLSQVDAGRAATRYLYGLGCRRIGHIAARMEPRARRRMDGYLMAIRDAGLDASGLTATTRRPSTVRLGAELFSEVLTQSPDLDGMFCCNDDLALGALFECQRRGIRVPDDISIIGFNDLEFCDSTFPSLTSVAIPRHEMARRAAEIVLEIVRGSGKRPRSRRIDLGFTIKDRQSTRPRQAVRRRSAAAQK